MIRIFILLLLSSSLFAQKNEYLFDLSSINPGAIAIKNTSISLFYSTKLIGIDKSPAYQQLNYQGMISENTAIGIHVLSETKGESGNTAFHFSYAHQLKVNQSFRLALGLQSEFNSSFIHESDYVVVDFNDIFISESKYQEYYQNASTGVFLYSKKTNIGLSVSNLFRTNIYSRKINDKSEMNYMAYLNYNIFSKKIIIDIGGIVDYVKNERFISSIHLKSNYKRLFFGSNVTNLGSVGIFTGFKTGKLEFYYLRSTPKKLNNTIVLGANEIKIIYILK
jgi:type IX secretion system PorP/SprF family membrane protein